MTLTTLDFETYFADDYTLSKMTTESYVRDPRFQALCLGVRNADGRDAIVPVEKISDYASALSAKAVICHHAHFDGLILTHHYNIRPKFYFDTLSMARLVFPHERSHSLGNLAKKFGLMDKSVPYNDFKNKRREDISPELMHRLQHGCLDDLALTQGIFNKLLPYVPKPELRLIDLTIRMFTEPVLLLDTPLAEEYLNEERVRKADLLAAIGATEDDLQSAARFADLLRAIGVEPPVKKSLKTGQQTYAFAKSDEAFKALLDHPDDRVVDLVNARLGVKSTIGETRAQRLLDTAKRGKITIYLKPFGAHTFRWAGGDKMNFQNFQRGGKLRKSLLAPPGYRIVVVDASQIECRVNACLAGEQWVLDAFAQHRDLYCEMGSDIYGRPITKADLLERFLGKTVILGAGFKMGWEKFLLTCKQKGITISPADAQKAINTYRAKHPKIAANWDRADGFLQHLYSSDRAVNWGPMQLVNKKIVLPNGSPMDYGALVYEGRDFFLLSRGKKNKIYGGRLVENVVQALSRVIIADAMLDIQQHFKIALTVHDEIVFLAREAEADQALEFALNRMRQSPNWMPNLPLDAEGGHDVRYSK